MSKNNIWIVLLFHTILYGCAQNNKQSYSNFHRSEEVYKVINYYSLKADHYYVIIIQDGMCNSCSVENIIELEKTVSTCLDKDFVFINNENYTVLSEIIGLKQNTTLLNDSLNIIQKYGLRLTKDLLFEIKDNKILYWNYLTEDNLPNISIYIKTNC